MLLENFINLCLSYSFHSLNYPKILLYFPTYSILYFLSINNQTNKLTTTTKNPHEVWFMLVGYFGVWGLSWNVADIPSVSSLKKNDFPLPNSKQILIASWLGRGPNAYSSPVFLDILFSILSLLNSYAMYHSLPFICESAQLCLENCACLKSPTISGSCNLLASLLHTPLSIEGKDMI